LATAIWLPAFDLVACFQRIIDKLDATGCAGDRRHWLCW
jgi:hypothetical protein